MFLRQTCLPSSVAFAFVFLSITILHAKGLIPLTWPELFQDSNTSKTESARRPDGFSNLCSLLSAMIHGCGSEAVMYQAWECFREENHRIRKVADIRSGKIADRHEIYLDAVVPVPRVGR